MVDLSPKARATADHVAVFAGEIVLHEGTARRIVLEIGKHPLFQPQ